VNFFKKIAMSYIREEFNDVIRKFLAGETVTGGDSTESVSSESAMRYSAVFSCVRVLAETYASCPIMLYKKNKDGSREPVNDLPIYDLLHSTPNEEMAAFNFKESTMMSLNLGGNAVIQKLYNRFGEVVGLYPFKWDRVKIERSKETNKLEYHIDGNKMVLQRNEVIHIPGLSFDGIIGLSPLTYAARSVNLGLSYEKFGVNFYKNGAHAGGILEHPNALSDASFERLKKDFANSYQGLANTGKPIILEDGMKYNPITIDPVDAQLLESRKFQVEDICRIYRVPLHLVQNLDRATNNNIEHQSLEFIMYTMLPWFKRSEDCYNSQGLTREHRQDGYYLEHKIDGLLRGDAKSRSEAYAAGRQWGWLSVNDIRKLENLNPIANGDIYLQPLNMGEAGKIQVEDNIKAQSEAIYKMITERK
jgi:HK97 family phage portal protein